MSDITTALREARKTLMALGMIDSDAEVHAINVCILEREASPVHSTDSALPRYSRIAMYDTFYANDVREMVVQEWHKIVKENGLKPGSTVEKLVGRLLARIDGI